MTQVTRVAGIDCGTNSLRLLVAEPGDDGRLVDLHREMRIVRLGEGVDATGRLCPEAIARTRAALEDYRDVMQGFGVEALRMVATSATRDASNRDEFFEMTADVLGAVVPGTVAEVISGAVEAELTFAGAVADLAPDDGPFVVTDLGGGSTEVVVGSVSADGPVLLGGHSVDVGCVRLTERVLHSDPPTSDEVFEARSTVQAGFVALADVPVEKARRWVGVAGTFTTMSALAQDLETYDPEALHGSVVTAARLREVCDGLLASTVLERLELGPMHEGRADVIGGGSVVVSELCDLMLERAGLDSVTISEKDILDGIAMSVLAR